MGSAMSLASLIIEAIEALGGRVRVREGTVEVASTEDVPDHLIEALRAESSEGVAEFLSARASARRAHELRIAEALAPEPELLPPAYVVGGLKR